MQTSDRGLYLIPPGCVMPRENSRTQELRYFKCRVAAKRPDFTVFAVGNFYKPHILVFSTFYCINLVYMVSDGAPIPKNNAKVIFDFR